MSCWHLHPFRLLPLLRLIDVDAGVTAVSAADHEPPDDRRIVVPGIGTTGTLHVRRADASAQLLNAYSFPHVFTTQDNNQTISSFLEPLVDRTTRGESFSIIADGFSGTGKSHTLLEGPGSIAKYVLDLCFGVKKLPEIWFSAAEVHHPSSKMSHQDGTEIRRILFDQTQLISIRSRIREMDTNDGLPGKPVAYSASSSEALGKILQWTQAQRETDATFHNLKSSRSHLICRFYIPHGNGGKFGVLTLGDLAGAEPTSTSAISQQLLRGRSSFEADMLSWAEGSHGATFRGSNLAKSLRSCFATPRIPVLNSPLVVWFAHVNVTQRVLSCSQQRLTTLEILTKAGVKACAHVKRRLPTKDA
jgi:hypothetical protein